MGAHRLKITIPEDHHLVLDIPEEVPSGPAELIVFPRQREVRVDNRPSPEEALRRFEEVLAHLSEDPRPFRELSREERAERLRLVRGSGRGLFSSAEERLQDKQEEIDIEERRLVR